MNHQTHTQPRRFRVNSVEAINAEADRIRAELEAEPVMPPVEHPQRRMNSTSISSYTPHRRGLTHDQVINVLAVYLRVSLEEEWPDTNIPDTLQTSQFQESFGKLVDAIGFTSALDLFKQELTAPNQVMEAVESAQQRVNSPAESNSGTTKTSRSPHYPGDFNSRVSNKGGGHPSNHKMNSRDPVRAVASRIASNNLVARVADLGTEANMPHADDFACGRSALEEFREPSRHRYILNALANGKTRAVLHEEGYFEDEISQAISNALTALDFAIATMNPRGKDDLNVAEAPSRTLRPAKPEPTRHRLVRSNTEPTKKPNPKRQNRSVALAGINA